MRQVDDAIAQNEGVNYSTIAEKYHLEELTKIQKGSYKSKLYQKWPHRSSNRWGYSVCVFRLHSISRPGKQDRIASSFNYSGLLLAFKIYIRIIQSCISSAAIQTDIDFSGWFPEQSCDCENLGKHESEWRKEALIFSRFQGTRIACIGNLTLTVRKSYLCIATCYCVGIW